MITNVFLGVNISLWLKSHKELKNVSEDSSSKSILLHSYRVSPKIRRGFS